MDREPRDFLSNDNDDIQQSSSRAPRDFLAESEQESLGTAAKLALPRIGEDLAKGGYNLFKNMPHYLQEAKTEIPGLFNLDHPIHRLGQHLAGITEAGHNALNIPHDLVSYATHRLNLLPQSSLKSLEGLYGSINNIFSNNNKFKEDITPEINQQFGETKYPGEALLRGIDRNALNLSGLKGIGSFINPTKFSAKNLAQDILLERKNQQGLYNQHYNNLFKEAENKGYGDSLYNVDADMDTLRKHSPASSIQGLEKFNDEPTLQNAQKAQSDLSKITRRLDLKTTLTDAERDQYKAAHNAITSIKKNMFVDKAGNLDNDMLDKYMKIQQGYANDVIPYKTNAINKFKAKKITAEQMLNSLSKGEFAVKRGNYHKKLMIRNALKDHPIMATASGLGAAGLLYKELMGNSKSE